MRGNPPSSRKQPPVIWITGASRGIGYEIAKAFSALPAVVVLTSRNKKKLVAFAKQLVKGGGEAATYVCDVTSEKSVSSTARAILRRFGHVDVLVNNAGTASFQSFRDTSLRQLNEVMQSNLVGTFLCSKAVLDPMIRRRSGHIFNIVSVAARTTFEASSAYSASKAAALALTDVLRKEVRQHNIKVTAVLAGATETALWNRKMRKRYRHRMMKPEDVAKIVVALYRAPKRAHIEEIVVRPQLGDLP